MERKEQLKQSRLYIGMQNISNYLDKYYLDAIAGLVPGGFGDAISALFALVHVYFSLFKLRSVALTLAILNNSMRDIFLGMIPFYIGNLIDFFHKANKQNMALIDGFINNDKAIIGEVNRKALQSLIAVAAFSVAIALMIALLVWIAQWLGTLIFS
ncbi:MAG TPA: DUF4112 domain-containing protein [Prevotella sp.]